MFWVNLFIVLNIVTLSSQYNLTVDFEKIAVSELYAQHVNEYVSKLGNTDTICAKHVMHYLKELVFGKKWWARKMFDAGTKIPSGLLSLKMADYGSFDECLSVKTNIENLPVYGKYCLGSIPFNMEKIMELLKFKSYLQPRTVNLDGELGFSFATCMPDSCTTQDIQNIYKNSGLNINIKFFDQFCHTKSDMPEFGYGAIIYVSFLGVILLIMILSTAYDLFLFYHDKKPKYILLVAFSVYTNGKGILKISTNRSNQISCLNGIRVISMMWIMLGHRYRGVALHPVQNGLEMLEWKDKVGNMYIMGANVAVDTFLLLSGLLVAYVFMSAMAKGANFNILIFYLHRYIRLTPVYAVLVLLHVTVLIHLGSGPFWKYDMSILVDGCKNNWWAGLLYIQNHVNSKGICIEQSWYLSVDTQLYLIAPLLLFPLKKWPNVGIIITSGLGVTSVVISFIIGYTYKLRGIATANTTLDYTKKYYLPAYTRAAPWLMGILLGYYIYKIKKSNRKIHLNKPLVLLLWIISLGILASCIFPGHTTLNVPYDRIANSFFIALLRPGWAIGVSMVILLCELGYGGPINWFLSVSIFEIFSKLTYTMYLTHMAMQFILVAQDRDVRYAGDLMTLHGFWGDYVFTAAVSVMFTLAFESPIVSLEKVILGNTNKGANKSLESNVNKENENL